MNEENQKAIKALVNEFQERMEPLLKDDTKSAVLVMVEYRGKRGGAKMIKRGCSHEMILGSMVFELGANEFMSQLLGKPITNIEALPVNGIGKPFLKILKDPTDAPKGPGIQ